MQRDTAAGISFGRHEVGQIAAKFDPGSVQLLQRVSRIANAVHNGASLEPRGWMDEKFLEFGGSFIISPVAHPDHINLLVAILRKKICRIGGFMECPHPVNAETVLVNAANSLAEGENAVELRKFNLQ